LGKERAATLCGQGCCFYKASNGSGFSHQPYFQRYEANGLHEISDGGAGKGIFLVMQSGKARTELRNITFEYNSGNDLIVRLNQFRKDSPEEASMIIRQMFDNACM
jgi:hypothetical protein